MRLYIYLIALALMVGVASSQVSIVNDTLFNLNNGAFITVLAPQNSTNITIYNSTDSPASTLQFYINGTPIRFTANTNKTLSNISYNNVTDVVTYTGNGTDGYLNVSALMNLSLKYYNFKVDGIISQTLQSSNSGWVTFNYTGWSQSQHDFEISIIPPSVTSNTNSVYVANNSLLALNATITNSGHSVNNATVNVSSVNSTINQAVLTNQSGFWINNSITADRGDTNGFVNLTITAYDNANNVNNSINMTVEIDATPPTAPANFTNTSEPTISSVVVSWNTSTDPNNGSGINKYQIERTNDSFNYLTVPRDIINASNISTQYEPDAYWYTFWTPAVADVSCQECHPLPQHPNVGNFWVKYNESFLYIIAHFPDNDTIIEDNVKVAFDNVSGATSPQPYDRLYNLSEDNILTSYTGNGTAWNITATTAAHFVNGSGTHAPRYEIRIPLSEIGNPGNNTVINFLFMVSKSNESGFVSFNTFFPLSANLTNPSTWKTITFRNFTDYVSIGNTTVTSSLIMDLTRT